jgi:acyl-CoA synthetase (AMP-forming)/AMP-acid ligase II/acyl carrier protein
MSQIRELSVPVILQAHARRIPESTAILAPGRKPLSYKDLFEQASYVVSKLNELGVDRNDNVAIVLPNGPEMAVAFLTVACGASSAPLNPGYGANEFDFYLADLNARALILLTGMDSPARDVAVGRGIPIIDLIPSMGFGAGKFSLSYSLGNQPSRPGFAQDSDVALVLHTSGTTSRPKMVPLTHTNICASAANISESLALNREDRCLNVMPLFHIHGLIGALLASITAGGSVVSTPGFESLSFFDWLQEFKPSWYSAVPTIHQAILAEVGMNSRIIAANRLRLIRSSSASLPPQVMADLEAAFQAPVIESYGMTEASHQMASNPLPPRARKPGSVGLPAGPEIAIMDTAGNLLEHGETGEIVIRGANVTRGYENNPEANNQAFTNGWFRTGDEGYFDPEGYLYLSGRIKEMINRGGEKIAPREVDEVFLQHPAVVQAVAFAIPHQTLGEDLAVAVVLKAGQSVQEKDLRNFSFTRVAGYKVPSQVLVLDKIPKGPTGKLQRIGLSEKLAEHLKAAYEGPRNDIEAALFNMWAEVLESEQFGVLDNFFVLGGDSLSATRLNARIQAAFGVNLPLGSIFREPTIAEQAVLIEEMLLDEMEAMDEEDAAEMSRLDDEGTI